MRKALAQEGEWPLKEEHVCHAKEVLESIKEEMVSEFLIEFVDLS
jgi:hypothetical protein